MVLAVSSKPTVSGQSQRQRRSFLAGYGLLVGFFLFVMQLMRLFPPAYGAAVMVLLLVLALAFYRPAVALGAAIALTIVGDAVAMPWWPVAKNLSASESILYTADPLTVKPVELLLLAVALVWLINRRLTPGAPPIVYGALWRPLLVFSVAMVVGMGWGLANGGDLRVAVFEITPLAYIPLIYLVATNLFTTIGHYQRLLAGIVAALSIEAIHGLFVLSSIRENIPADASPVEHTAVLHMNILLLLLVATVWFGSKHPAKWVVLFLVAIPTTVLFIDAQRRAGVVAMIIGGLLLTVVLFTRNRRLFYLLVPAILVVTAVYVAAFWNSEGAAGFPAQAIKTVLQPDASTEKDASSDLYREIENFNLNVTVRSNPVLGIGFGRPFLQPIRLPDISFFEFAPYIPHNSVLWIWTKVGFIGFVSFLYSIAVGTAAGVRAAIRERDPDNAAMIAVMAAYLPMTLVLAFVEITFDASTTVLLGVALASTTAAATLSTDEDSIDPETDPSESRRPEMAAN